MDEFMRITPFVPSVPQMYPEVPPETTDTFSSVEAAGMFKAVLNASKVIFFSF